MTEQKILCKCKCKKCGKEIDKNQSYKVVQKIDKPVEYLCNNHDCFMGEK